jgi:hypothetical protein
MDINTFLLFEKNGFNELIETRARLLNTITNYDFSKIENKQLMNFIYDFKNITDSLKMSCENIENLIENSNNNFTGDESINNIIEKERVIVFYNLLFSG